MKNTLIMIILVLVCLPVTAGPKEPLKSATFHVDHTSRLNNQSKWLKCMGMLWMDAPTEPGVRACRVSQFAIDHSGEVVIGPNGQVLTNRVIGAVVTNAAGELMEVAKLAAWVDHGYETWYVAPETNVQVDRYNVSMDQTGNVMTDAKRTAMEILMNVPANKLRIDFDVENPDALSEAYGLWRGPTHTNIP